ncbi:MAG: hypothetical protein LH606_20555 [Cytophagaceae bacterium]|nr:hypothetical protein [Cytophagaceae bacterium]
MSEGRGAWVQMVSGQVQVAGLTLAQGDGVGITDIDKLDFHFGADSEVLLFDVRMDTPLLWRWGPLRSGAKVVRL